jgi:hypothetical protein
VLQHDGTGPCALFPCNLWCDVSVLKACREELNFPWFGEETTPDIDKSVPRSCAILVVETLLLSVLSAMQ